MPYICQPSMVLNTGDEKRNDSSQAMSSCLQGALSPVGEKQKPSEERKGRGGEQGGGRGEAESLRAGTAGADQKQRSE